MIISVIQVGDEQTIKTARGGYKQFDIAYRANGKVEGKVFRDFVYPEVYKTARSLQIGDVATVSLDKEAGKDGKEYWQWTSLRIGAPVEGAAIGGGAATASKDVSSGSPAHGIVGKPVGRVTGSNYETPEERAARQINIVRQSCIGYALKFFEQTQADISRDDVIELAEWLKTFVFDGLPTKVAPVESAKATKVRAKKASDAIADMEDDVPY